MYDPAAPRFWQLDPLSEKSRRFSPYTYAQDNPVFFIDKDGMAATPPDWYIDKRTGAILGHDGVQSNDYRLVDGRDFQQIKSDNGGSTTTQTATNQLQENSQFICVNEEQIGQEIQTVSDLSRTNEHQTAIVLDKYTAEVSALRGTPGTVSGEAIINVRVTACGASVASNGSFYLANVHGHNKITEANKINETGTSQKDRVAAMSDPKTTIYAIDSYNVEVGGQATIGRVNGEGVKTDNIGSTQGATGRPTVNIGQDALDQLPR